MREIAEMNESVMVKCACGHCAAEVQAWRASATQKYPADKDVYLRMWYWGGEGGVLDKLKYAVVTFWRALKHGSPEPHEICLGPERARLLAQALNGCADWADAVEQCTPDNKEDSACPESVSPTTAHEHLSAFETYKMKSELEVYELKNILSDILSDILYTNHTNQRGIGITSAQVRRICDKLGVKPETDTK